MKKGLTKKAYLGIIYFVIRGVAQFGRAPRLGRGGRRFESCRSDQSYS